MKRADILLKNAVIVTMDQGRRIIDQGVVAVKGRYIAAVGGEELQKEFQGEREIDCKGNILLPGLINCHSHAGHCLMGKLESDTMKNWWPMLIQVYENYADSDFWYTDGKLHGASAIHNGITTTVNVMGSTPMGDCPEIPISHGTGYIQTGGREILGVGIPYGESYPKRYTRWKDGRLVEVRASYDDMIAGTEETLRRMQGAFDGLTHVFVTPHQLLMGHAMGESNPGNLSTLTPMELDINQKVRQLAQKDNTQIYTDTYGGWITLAYTDKENMLLGPDVLIGMEHVAAANYKELEIFRQTGTKMYYTAEGYYKRTPISEAVEMGIPVGITTNGCAPRTTLDLLESLRRVLLSERIFHDDNRYLPAMKALEMVTVDAAKCIGFEESLGSIEQGKLADLVQLDWMKDKFFPQISPIDKIVYEGSGGDFSLAVVNGKIVMEEGRLTGVDEEEILEEADQIHRKVVRDCHLEAMACPVIFGRTRVEKTD